MILSVIIILFLVGSITISFGINLDSIFSSIVTFLPLFVLGFLPGLYYFKLDEKIYGKLISWSIGLEIVGILISLPIVFYTLACLITRKAMYCDAFAFGGALILFGIPALILYSIGILLLIINWSRKRK